jgi:Mrp family chromosome partitioning ATPase
MEQPPQQNPTPPPRPTSESGHGETLGFRDYVRPVWAHKWLIGFLVAIATVGTYFYYERKPPVYESSTKVFVETQASGTDADRVISDQIPLVKTDAVAARVARRISFGGNPRALLGSVSATGSQGSDYITISTSASKPEMAGRLANAFAQAFIDMRAADRRDQTEAELSALRRRLASTVGPGSGSLRRSLQRRIDHLQLVLSTPSADAQQVDRARPPSAPAAPNPRRNAIFAFVLSLLVGVIVAFWLERADRRLKTAEEAEQAYGLPVIGRIPHQRRIAARVGEEARVAAGVREAFRALRSNLELIAGRLELRTILVTSALPGEGKSTVVRNLALVYAEAGLRVAVVEADMRTPSLATYLGAKPEPGLTDAMMGHVPLAAVTQHVPVHVAEPLTMRAGSAREAARKDPIARFDPLRGEGPRRQRGAGRSRGRAGAASQIDPRPLAERAHLRLSRARRKRAGEDPMSPGEPQAAAGSWGVLTLDQLKQELEDIAPPENREADEPLEPVEEHRLGVTDAAAPASEADGEAADGRGRLVLITSGPQPPDPPAMFSAPALPALLEHLSVEHDVVIIDSPPMLAVSDTVHLMSVVDGTVLVSRVGTSTGQDAERVLTLTDRVPNARVLGVVINDVEDGGRSGLYKSA